MNSKQIALLIGVFVVGVLAASAVWIFVDHSNAANNTAAPSPKASVTRSPTVSPTPLPDVAGTRGCPAQITKTVSTASELRSALYAASAGDVIQLKPGTYSGQFEAKNSGTTANPIWLCGSRSSVIDGGDISKGYAFHLDGASYWRLEGFAVHGGQKGVVVDGGKSNVIENVAVSDVGDEGIHLRDNSTDNLVQGNTVSHTGNLKPKFGEGIYIGSAKSNWCSVTNCQPDRSDHNVIKSNTIFDTTAENVDIKEGTTGGQLIDNSFNGNGMVEAGGDSWVDVKGNSWTIDGNKGVDSINDGFQSHQILDGWGDHNVFSNNTAAVNGPGFGFHLAPALHNVVECNNVVTGAARGSSNIKCTNG